MIRHLLLIGALIGCLQARAYSHNPFNPMDWPYFPTEVDFQLYTLSLVDCDILRVPNECDREWSYKFPERGEIEAALNVARSELALVPARAKKHFNLALKRNQAYLKLLRESKAELLRLLWSGHAYDADLTRMLAQQGDLLPRKLLDEYLDTKNAQEDLVKYTDVFTRLYPAVESSKSLGERHRAQIAFAQSWQAIKRARLAELEARPTFNDYMSRVAWVAGNRFGIVNFYMKQGARRSWFYEFPGIELLTLKSDASCPATMIEFVREKMRRKQGFYFQQDLTGEIDSIPEGVKYKEAVQDVVNLTNSAQRQQMVRLLKKKEFQISCVKTASTKDLMVLNIRAGTWKIPYHFEKESLVADADVASPEVEVPKYHFHEWPEVLRKSK